MTAWAAAADGVAEWWAGAVRRGTTPPQLMLDSVTWWAEMVNRRRPTWSSPNRIVFEAPVARLRDFSTRSRKQVVPTLVLPPQAGHDSCIVDYSAEQSQIQAILAAGLTRAYSLDWIGATDQTKHAHDRRLPRGDRPVNRPSRRHRQPGRRLPGRLAGDDLRGAGARTRQHADDRGRSDRLPRGRSGDRRGAALVGADRQPRLLPVAGRRRRRHPRRPAHARWLHHDPARQRGRPTTRVAGQHQRPRARRALPRVRGLVQVHPADPPGSSTCGSSSTCSATTS